jgi:hypothetical protein
VGTQPQGTQGTVQDGPTVAGANNITWYLIDYDSGTDGWSGEGALSEVGCTSPPPDQAPAGPLSAFPGAEGAGAVSKGGRGGVLRMVTSLANSGPGTLRECVEASGARACVFRRGGSINVASTLTITNPNITIAGQTAPGGGIELRGTFAGNMIIVNGSDVIIRYIRIRHEDACPPRVLGPNAV